ncbi:DMT family transporter [Alteromonas sediminis]|uniref:DMT family transporter n=1 Tax=Alteromonas sediminis TaxID=2259342 RepID=A0A3N5XY25_9ALTE|nr:DMT family transporter [Alteromonas sediminis]RPJ65470.1 DMT family transporter [Alteromonas sediminis]
MGEVAALSTALCWAIAARLFRVLGRSFSPLALNFYKGLVAIVLLWVITTFFIPGIALPNSAYIWLLLSGVIGIGLGDTFFFQALNKIGDSQSILVAETLAPIFTALMAMAWINEWLTWEQWLGIAIVIFSVDVIVKIQKKDETQIFVLSGYVFAGLAALCQAVGAVISRDILTTYTDLDAFNASQIRLIGGMAIIVILMLVMRQNWKPKTENVVKTWQLFAAATVLGTVAALYLQMLAFQHTKAAIVQTLFATSVVLSLGVALVLGEKVSKKTALWSVTALIGVSVLVFAE